MGLSARVVTGAAVILLWAGWPAAAEREQATGRVSKRNANYSIDVELDPSSRTFQGREVLTWRTIPPQRPTELQFHLYYNAWTNNRWTWIREHAGATFGRNLAD